MPLCACRCRGGGYDLPLFGRFHIVPGVYFDYGLTPVVRSSGWKMHPLLFRADLTMAL